MTEVGLVPAHGRVGVAWFMLAVVVAAACALTAPATTAHAHERHRSAPVIPGGGGFLNSTSYEAGSYAFAVRKNSATYLVTARHVAPRGATVYGPGGLLGAADVVSGSRDASYVRLDSDQADADVQIATTASGAAVDATMAGIAPRGSITVGQRVCHSGYSESTQDAGGYICGEVVDVPSSCDSYQPGNGCEITMRSDAGEKVGWLGDSGGPVWQQAGPGQVRLVGVFTSVSALDGGPPTLGHFVPAFDVLDDLGGVPVNATS